MVLQNLLFCGIALLLSHGLASAHILGHTEWGFWGPEVAKCSTNNFVNGFRLKVESDQGPARDDSALNAVRLRCTDHKNDAELVSREGPFGKWTEWQMCPVDHHVQKIRFRSEPDSSFDNTAANNMDVMCSDGTWLRGKGLIFGTWEEYDCTESSGLCGFNARVQPKQGLFQDDTAMNQIDLACCPLL